MCSSVAVNDFREGFEKESYWDKGLFLGLIAGTIDSAPVFAASGIKSDQEQSPGKTFIQDRETDSRKCKAATNYYYGQMNTTRYYWGTRASWICMIAQLKPLLLDSAGHGRTTAAIHIETPALLCPQRPVPPK